MKDPIRYSDELETIDEGEDETIREMNATFDMILERVAEDEGHAYRSVHAKSHGLIAAKITIHDDLPAELGQGIFARPGTHEAILRISTNPGDLLDDSISVPRGMALKVLNVEGERLGAEFDSTSQDFVMANGPVFAAATAEDFAKTLKTLARTTDRAEWGKKLASKALRGINKVVGPSPTLQTLGGAPNTHPMGETYYTKTPYRYGEYVAKLQLVPVSEGLKALTGQKIDASGRPDALREEVDRAMRDGPAEWELRVQLLRDTESQPIEDASVAWDEEAFPFVAVATVTAKAQPAWSEARATAVDDGMRFAPRNGIVEHRPLGSINRARNASYDHSARFRERVNGCPIHDPRVASLPE